VSGLLTSARWRELADDLPESPDAVRALVVAYLALLPLRTLALTRALHARDAVAVRTAARSLHVGSAMVGAHLLADRCHAVERHVAAQGCDQDAARSVEAARDAADATGRVLVALLRRCDELVAHAPDGLDPAR
jgi:HPt (histidine-containing phosphotransfer) domain-containing protein